MISHKPNTLNDIPLARRQVLLFTTSWFSCFLFVSLPFWGHIWNMISYSPTLLIYGQTQNNGLIYAVCVYPCIFQINSVSSSLFLVFLMLQLPLIPSLLFCFLPIFEISHNQISLLLNRHCAPHRKNQIFLGRSLHRTDGWLTEDILWHWGIHKHGVCSNNMEGQRAGRDLRREDHNLISNYEFWLCDKSTVTTEAFLPAEHWQR